MAEQVQILTLEVEANKKQVREIEEKIERLRQHREALMLRIVEKEAAIAYLSNPDKKK